jgi:hypothetical protein
MQKVRRVVVAAAAVAVTAAVLLIGACSRKAVPATVESLRAVRAHDLASYTVDLASPVVDRVAEAPGWLLTWLRAMDSTDAYTAYLPTAAERRMLSDYLGLLPAGYAQTLKERVVAIYFINGFQGSGMADFALDAGGRLSCVLYLNPETMRHTLSDWMTTRESSAFSATGAADAGTTLRVDCGSAYTGLLYVLMHEGTHIMDYAHGCTPYMEPELDQAGIRGSTSAFVSDTWTGYSTPRHQPRFSANLTFYGRFGGPKLHLSQAKAVYDELAASPFVSLYGSTAWVEDFAEYCTWSWLTGQLGQPYRITVQHGGDTLVDLQPMSLPQAKARAAQLPKGLLDS